MWPYFEVLDLSPARLIWLLIEVGWPHIAKHDHESQEFVPALSQYVASHLEIKTRFENAVHRALELGSRRGLDLYYTKFSYALNDQPWSQWVSLFPMRGSSRFVNRSWIHLAQLREAPKSSNPHNLPVLHSVNILMRRLFVAELQVQIRFQAS